MGGGGGLGDAVASGLTMGMSDVVQGHLPFQGAISGIGGALQGFNPMGDTSFHSADAHILNPATADQATEQYGNMNTGLQQQQSFLQALQAQNGLQNQSDVYNQMQGIANGTGPNPAQMMLNNATGQNVANQAALMASQRGAGANVGLMARQAANQGAGIQQNAAGQAALMQAQQQQAALNQMGGMATNMANQQANATNAYTNAAQGAYGNVNNAIQGQNNANVSFTNGVNSANVQADTERTKGRNNLIGNVMGGIGAAFGLAEGGQVPHLAEGGGIIDTIKAAFADPPKPASTPKPAPTPDPEKAKAFMKGFGYADGGGVTPLIPSQGATSGPQSNVGQYFQQAQNYGSAGQPADAMSQGSFDFGKGVGGAVKGMFSGSGGSEASGLMAGGAGDAMESMPMLAAQGGKVPAMVSPGEKYLDRKDVSQVKKGANPMEVGKTIPGKPVVGGAKNSYANDIVPAKLEEGGIVLPRSVTQAKDPAKAAAEFVRQILDEKKHKAKKK
jgi:hypothetical protein